MERVGTVILESNEQSDAELIALEEIDKSLGIVCFSYNTEASIRKSALYVVDLTSSPNKMRVSTERTLRSSYVAEKPQDVLLKIQSLPRDKKTTLELALKYYKLSYYDNPYILESLFSCLSTIIRQ